jgi:hypothetical protein
MDSDTAAAFAALKADLRRIERKVDQVRLSEQQQAIGDLIMSQQLDDLTAQVTANTDTEASAIQLLTNLHDLLVQAGTDPAKLDALKQQLATSKEALAAAIVANTPAAPTA